MNITAPTEDQQDFELIHNGLTPKQKEKLEWLRERFDPEKRLNTREIPREEFRLIFDKIKGKLIFSKK